VFVVVVVVVVVSSFATRAYPLLLLFYSALYTMIVFPLIYFDVCFCFFSECWFVVEQALREQLVRGVLKNIPPKRTPATVEGCDRDPVDPYDDDGADHDEDED
jgi:hypothetical protein